MYVYICTCIIIYTHTCAYIWVNYNISLTWIVRPIWGWFPLLTMIPVRSQWGRYNLPIYIYIYIVITSLPGTVIQWLHHGALQLRMLWGNGTLEPHDQCPNHVLLYKKTCAGIIPRYFFLNIYIYLSIYLQYPSIYLSMHACMFHNIIYNIIK